MSGKIEFFANIHNGRLNCIDTLELENNKNKYIASGGNDCYVMLFDASNGLNPLNENNTSKTFSSTKFYSPILNIKFCLDKNSKIRLIIGEKETINFCEIKDIELIKLKTFSHNTEMNDLFLIQNSNKVISCNKSYVKIWNYDDISEEQTLSFNEREKTFDNIILTMNSSGTILAIFQNDKKIKLYDFKTKKRIFKITISEMITSMKFILNDIYLLYECTNGGSLGNYFKKYMEQFNKPFPEEIVQYIMRQLSSGLKYSLQLIHLPLDLLFGNSK